MFASTRRSITLKALLLLLALFSFVTVVVAQPDSPRIVGGQEADPGEWPWQVALVYKGYDTYNGQYCGGSLLAPYWVLTAAHCVDSLASSELEVAAGIHDLVSPDPGYRRVAVRTKFVHPGWDRATARNDIALLYLDEPVEARRGGSDNLPIAYVDLATPDDGNLAGAISTVTGWGTRDPNSYDFPERLHEVEVPVVTNAECRRVYGGITGEMLCAGAPDGGRDSCFGDSGGPLVVFDDDEERWELAGIVSFGLGCGLPGWPGVYTRVSSFEEWLQETLTIEFTERQALMPLALSPPDPPMRLIDNGDFEAGAEGWAQSSLNGWTLIYERADLPPNRPPYGGDWAAWLGGDHNESASISQVVDVTEERPFLAFYRWIDSLDYCSFDFARIRIDGVMVDEFTLCDSTTEPYWTRYTLDLGAYAGQTVMLEIAVDTDFSGTSNLFIDNVGFTDSSVISPDRARGPSAPQALEKSGAQSRPPRAKP